MVPEIVTDIEPLDDLREEWGELLTSSAANNLFLTWEWVSSWCTHMLKSTETPFIITAREGSRLVGIAPLIKDRHRFLGDYYHIIGQKYSYHLGFISKKGREKETFSVLLSHLLNSVGKKLFVLDFLHLDEDPDFETALYNESGRRGYYVDRRIQNPCFVLTLPESFDEYMNTGIPVSSQKRNIKNDLTRLNKEVGFYYYEANGTDFEDCWITFMSFHKQMRLNQKTFSALTNQNFEEHLKQIALHFQVFGDLHMNVLSIHNEVSSILVGINYNGVLNSLSIGLDYSQNRKMPWLSLNVISHIISIKLAIEKHCTEFDFLGGDHDFKRKMGGKEKGGIRITVYRSGFHRIIENALSRYIVPLLKKQSIE